MEKCRKCGITSDGKILEVIFFKDGTVECWDCRDKEAEKIWKEYKQDGKTICKTCYAKSGKIHLLGEKHINRYK